MQFKSWWLAGRFYFMFLEGIAPVPSLFWEKIECFWSKIKSIAFQVSEPALEVNISFRLQTWFISRFLASVLLGIGGLHLVPISQDIQLITLRWEGWFRFNHLPPILDISCYYVEFTFCVCRNSYGLVNTEICINSLICSLLDIDNNNKS